jgi:hypothetical protein
MSRLKFLSVFFNGNSVTFLFDIPEESVVTATTLGV